MKLNKQLERTYDLVQFLKEPSLYGLMKNGYTLRCTLYEKEQRSEDIRFQMNNGVVVVSGCSEYVANVLNGKSYEFPYTRIVLDSIDYLERGVIDV